MAVIALSAVLRVHGLARKSLWDDEIFSLNAIGIYTAGQEIPPLLSIPWNVVKYYRADNHPPFFFVLLGVWVELFGSGTLALRMLPVVINLATLPILYVLARRLFDEKTGLIAATLFGSSAYLVFFSQEARMYPLLLLLSCLSSLFFLDVLETGRRRHCAAFALVSTIGLYTHYYYGFLLAFQVVYWILRRRGRVFPFVLGLAGVAAAFVPWMPVLLYQISYKNQSDLWIRNSGQYTWGVESLMSQWLGILFRFIAGENFIYPNTQRGLRSLCLVLAAAALLIVVQKPSILRRRHGGFLVAWLLSPLLAGALIDTFFSTRTLEASKYFMASYPPLVLILAAAIRGFPIRESVPVLLAGWLWLNANSLAVYYRSSSPVEWRDIAAYLSLEAGNSDLVIAPEPRVFTCVAFYLQRPLRTLQFAYGTGPQSVIDSVRAGRDLPRRLWLVTAYETAVPQLTALSRSLAESYPVLSERAFPSHAVVRSYAADPLGGKDEVAADRNGGP